MGRSEAMAARVDARETAIVAQKDELALVEEVESLSSRPEDVPAEVWSLIQENGRLATERLYEVLVSPKFTRLRAGDQAKLIALAQNRAYGMPKANKPVDDRKRAGSRDVVMAELDKLVTRALLPEYKNVIDVELEEERSDLGHPIG